jgi:hypothetical protein
MSERKRVAGNITFTVAGREDDADLRALLRSNATGGWIRLALAREPDAFAAAATMGRHHGYVVARDQRTREPVGMCEWSARDCYVDGQPRLLSYLGALRVAPRYRHRLGVLKGGFAAVRQLLHDDRATPYALTAIASDNHTALRLLGANLPGLPAYRPLENFSTFALRPHATRKLSVIDVQPARREDLCAIAVCLDRTYRQYQFAPLWHARDLADPARCRGLKPDDFLVVRRGPGIAACVALWDQNTFKQTIVQGYAGQLRWLRPFVNLAAPLLRVPRLPARGEPLSQVFFSHLAVENNDTELFQALIRAALAQAHRRGHTLALVGLATRHPLAQILTHGYRAREYRTLLHLVQWNQEGEVPSMTRLPHVEIAVM